MRKYKNLRMLAAVLAGVLVIEAFGGIGTPYIESYAYTERTATVNATSLNVRSGPGTGYSLAGKLGAGASVTVIDEKTASDGALWYQIRFSGTGGAQTTGYVLSSFIKFPVAYTNDGAFEALLSSERFPESYKTRLRQLHALYPNWVFRAQHTNLDWNTAVKEESQIGRTLVSKSSVSSWKSTEAGAFNWDTSTWTAFDGSAWVAASEDIVRYYMDPRNFLDEINVFQFLTHSYDSNSHTVDGLKTMVKGTFLDHNAPGGTGNSGDTPADPSGGGSGGSSTENSGGPGVQGPGAGLIGPGETKGAESTAVSPDNAAPSTTGSSGVSLESPHASITPNVPRVLMEIGPGIGIGPGQTGGSSSPSSAGAGSLTGSQSYVDIIMNAGTQSGVNPYVLAAMIIQEQGSGGTSGSISGTESGYEGIYNYFNIEAYQSGGMSPIQRGLWWASQSGSYDRPWNSPEKAILGGATFYGNNYVKVGQDTFYLKKFNVQGSNLYKHQYMTNVQGAASEGAVYAKAYNDEMKRTALEFKIPVFNNMPENPSGQPVADGSPNNKLSGLGADGFVLTPTFNRDTTDYNLIVDPSVSSVNITASALDSTASISGTGSVNLESGSNQVTVAVKAQNGSVRNYVIHVVRQDNGPTYSSSLSGGASGGGSPSGGASGNSGNTGNTGNSGGPGANMGPGGTGGTSAGDSGSSGTGGPSGDSGQTSGGSGTPGGSNVIIAPDGSGGAPAPSKGGSGGAVQQAPGA